MAKSRKGGTTKRPKGGKSARKSAPKPAAAARKEDGGGKKRSSGSDASSDFVQKKRKTNSSKESSSGKKRSSDTDASSDFVQKKRKTTSGKESSSATDTGMNGGDVDGALSAAAMEKFMENICAPRQLGMLRSNSDAPDPSRGGSTGYPVAVRKILIKLYDSGCKVPKSLRRSIQRWKQKGVHPKKQTGNRPGKYPTGEHLFLVSLFKKVWPQASRPQCATFVALYSGDGRVLTNTEVTKAFKRLDFTRKKASTTAYQAFTPRNVRLHYCFWNLNFPAGINDVPMERLMDGDEMAFHLGDASLGFGHAVKGLRVRKAGHYSRGKQKIVVIMFVEPGDPSLPADVAGSREKPRIWYEVSNDSGTTVETYQAFLENRVFPYFKADEPQRTLMHDNLSSHKADEIYETVHNAGHRVICRPPYRPYEAPIEWVFNQLACSVRSKWETINTEDQLMDAIRGIIEDRDGLGGFYELFQSCGYKSREQESGTAVDQDGDE